MEDGRGGTTKVNDDLLAPGFLGKSMRRTVYQAAVALLALAALIYGRPVSYPDNVHTLHGLPLTWGYIN